MLGQVQCSMERSGFFAHRPKNHVINWLSGLSSLYSLLHMPFMKTQLRGKPKRCRANRENILLVIMPIKRAANTHKWAFQNTARMTSTSQYLFNHHFVCWTHHNDTEMSVKPKKRKETGQVTVESENRLISLKLDYNNLYGSSVPSNIICLSQPASSVTLSEYHLLQSRIV